MTRIDLRTWRSGDEPPRAYAYRMTLDGEDLSNECFLADDVTGEVGLYVRDGAGHFHRDKVTCGAAYEFRKGVVALIPPPPLSPGW